jgi:hypothetical protein
MSRCMDPLSTNRKKQEGEPALALPTVEFFLAVDYQVTAVTRP